MANLTLQPESAPATADVAPFTGQFLTPGQRAVQKRANAMAAQLASIERTPALAGFVAIFQALDSETQQRAHGFLKVMQSAPEFRQALVFADWIASPPDDRREIKAALARMDGEAGQ